MGAEFQLENVEESWGWLVTGMAEQREPIFNAIELCTSKWYTLYVCVTTIKNKSK